MNSSVITRELVSEQLRTTVTAKIFGIYFPLYIEPSIFQLTSNISSDYNGGYWDFYQLSNNGFYMAPAVNELFKVEAENGFTGLMTGDELGITTCLYAFSHLSFSKTTGLSNICGEHFHLLREYLLQQDNPSKILRAID